MTTTELIAAIDQIKKVSLEDIKGRMGRLENNSSFFVVINDNDVVNRTSSISFIYNQEFKYAFLIVEYGYITNSWSKTNWELAAFLTPNNILTEIVGQNWTLTGLSFGFTPYGSMAPIFNLKLNNDITKKITYDVNPDRFDLGWGYFLELSSNCVTSQEAQIYLKYLKERSNREGQDLTIEDYKFEISEKENIINQYKELLSLVEDKIKKA